MTRIFWDEMAKSFLQEVLEPAGKPETEHRIVAHEAQFADLWFEPDPNQADKRRRLGWLGTMSEQACIFETFSNLPQMDDVRECLRKVLGKHHHRMMEHKKKGHAWPDMPRLWIIAPVIPKGLAQAFGFQPSPSWPSGIKLSPRGIQLGWVALAELPKTRETLMLRLILARGTIYEQAQKELDELPDDAWEKWAVNWFVFEKFRRLVDDRQNGRRELGKEEKEFIMNSEQRWAMLEREVMEKGRLLGFKAGRLEGRKKGRQEGREEGREEGRQEALRSMLMQIYKSRFSKVPRAISNALRAEQSSEQLLAWSAVFSTRSPKEIASALGISSRL